MWAPRGPCVRGIPRRRTKFRRTNGPTDSPQAQQVVVGSGGAAGLGGEAATTDATDPTDAPSGGEP